MVQTMQLIIFIYIKLKDTEEVYDAYFINLPVSPNRVELVETHNKFDENKINAYEKKNKEIEEKIKKFGITSSKILPYIKLAKKGFDMCEHFDDGDEYVDYIINSALEILFKEIWGYKSLHDHSMFVPKCVIIKNSQITTFFLLQFDY